MMEETPNQKRYTRRARTQRLSRKREPVPERIRLTGCEHVTRNCKVKFMGCKRIWGCHICHNEECKCGLTAGKDCETRVICGRCMESLFEECEVLSSAHIEYTSSVSVNY
jgi:hypothetical protein